VVSAGSLRPARNSGRVNWNPVVCLWLGGRPPAPRAGRPGRALRGFAALEVSKLASRNGVLVATSADLCNLNNLVADVRARCNWSGDSVAELIVELYGLYGLSFVEKLEGSFSVALWDAGQQQLALASIGGTGNAFSGRVTVDGCCLARV